MQHVLVGSHSRQHQRKQLSIQTQTYTKVRLFLDTSFCTFAFSSSCSLELYFLPVANSTLLLQF